MKKMLLLAICLGLSGCYVPADYYYEDSYVVSDGYAPAYSTTYVATSPSVVYVDQPAVVYYDSPLLRPRPNHHPQPQHYNPPHHSHHAVSTHGDKHKPQSKPHGEAHHGGNSGSHHGGNSGAHHGHHK